MIDETVGFADVVRLVGSGCYQCLILPLFLEVTKFSDYETPTDNDVVLDWIQLTISYLDLKSFRDTSSWFSVRRLL